MAEKRELLATGLLRLLVPAGRKQERHVTAGPYQAVCGLVFDDAWYWSDAGEFGRSGDCDDCYRELEARE